MKASDFLPKKSAIWTTFDEVIGIQRFGIFNLSKRNETTR